MSTSYLFISILGMFLATYAVRLVPLVWFNGRQLPAPFRVWLSYVPVVIFTALLAGCTFDEIQAHPSLIELAPFFISCFITVLITLKTKSISWGMGGGLLAF